MSDITFHFPPKKRQKTKMSNMDTGPNVAPGPGGGASSSTDTASKKKTGRIRRDPAERKRNRDAMASARKPVASGVNYVSDALRRQPIQRFCWSPKFPFPPVVETTLEEEVYFHWMPSGINGGTGIRGYMDAGTGYQHESNVLRIPTNLLSPLKNGSTPTFTRGAQVYPKPANFHQDGSLIIAEVNGYQVEKNTPFFNEFSRHYEKSIVIATRLVVKIESINEEQMDQPYLVWMKKHSPVNGRGTVTPVANPNIWDQLGSIASNAEPTTTQCGLIEFDDYNAEGLGNFMERAPLFEDKLSKMVKHPRTRGHNGTAIYHDTWSLQADEGVSWEEVLATHASGATIDNDEAIADPTLAGVANDAFWAAGYDPRGSGTYNTPRLQPCWYLFMTPPANDDSWFTATNNYVTPSYTAGQEAQKFLATAPANGGGALANDLVYKVTVKKQYDILFYQYHREDETTRDEQSVA